MDLLRSLAVHFLILCFMEKVTSIEIETFQTNGVGKKAHREIFMSMEIFDANQGIGKNKPKGHITSRINEYNKRVKEKMMKNKINDFVNIYEKQIEDDKNSSPKVEVIDTEEAMTSYKDPCKARPCHHQAICISIGKI